MKLRHLLTLLLCMTALTGKAQSNDFFTPVHKNALRLPAVPIITVDPYFCLWSKYDTLFEGSVTHWSGVNKPFNGAIYVDGTAYRFMGESMESLFPFAAEKAWTGKYVTSTPSGDWTGLDYDDSSWQSGDAPWGGGDDSYEKVVKTTWEGGGAKIYVRRTLTLDSIDNKASYYVMYKHDDVFDLYVNGTKVLSTGETWDVTGTALYIDKSLLREGNNVIACYCYNTSGGAFVDMGLYKSVLHEPVQKSCSVTATSTYYTFTCGPVDLDMVFTTPQVMDDLTLFSTPIGYISYRVQSNDGKAHDVRLFLQTSAEMAVRNTSQTTVNRRKVSGGFEYRYCGNSTQNLCNQTSDLIDWGYLYAFCDNKEGHHISCGDKTTLLKEFSEKGTATNAYNTKTCPGGTYCSIVYTDSIGTVNGTPRGGFTMLGYDDVASIQYFSNNRKGYWANNGRTAITARFEDLYNNYDSIMTLCRATDEKIYNDAYAVGGTKYAEIVASAYRQTNAAHKLFKDSKGNLMFMSRENNSGGFINTLDVTYPSQPLYWTYSPALAKAMITPVYEYNALGKWKYDFPNHDLGHYPQANGNHYGNPAANDGSTMPVEQSGNMLTLTAIIAKLDGDLDYLRNYLQYMTKWADYLVENGKDPVNQLCTDDFMGSSSRNTNLAAKAIMGVMSYSEICRMLGDDTQADAYAAKAQEMATYWIQNAKTTSGGTHYLLNFGAASSTWSTKYNLVWDNIWDWGLFSTVRKQEQSFYYNKTKAYGLPLDSRGDLCKSDWQMWAYGFAETNVQRVRLVNLLWKYINETTSRVPISDNHHANTGKQAMFQARSVVGGYWMGVFVSQYKNGTLTGIECTPATPEEADPCIGRSEWYDLYGRQLSKPLSHGITIKDGKKTLR